MGNFGGSISRIRSTGCLGVASMAMHTIPVLSKPSFDTQNGDRYFSTSLHCSSSSSEDLYLVAIHLLFQRHFQRIYRIYVKMSVCPTLLSSVNELVKLSSCPLLFTASNDEKLLVRLS